jgi:hypothetical protein
MKASELLRVRELRNGAIGGRVELLLRWAITYAAKFEGCLLDCTAILVPFRSAFPEPLHDTHRSKSSQGRDKDHCLRQCSLMTPELEGGGIYRVTFTW